MFGLSAFAELTEVDIWVTGTALPATAADAAREQVREPVLAGAA